MYLLARAYQHGLGVRRDEDLALQWYLRAADQEYGPALQELALIHRHGQLGVPADEGQFHRFSAEALHAIDHPVPPP
jgi:TPR repeat protein